MEQLETSEQAKARGATSVCIFCDILLLSFKSFFALCPFGFEKSDGMYIMATKNYLVNKSII